MRETSDVLKSHLLHHVLIVFDRMEKEGIFCHFNAELDKLRNRAAYTEVDNDNCHCTSPF